ncbi:sensor domain-containing diguanylate cyclase, partial [Rhodopseudomonas palustris]
RAQTVLGRNVDASGATLGQILDASGSVVASSDDRELKSLGAPNAAAASYFQAAIAGGEGRQFVKDAETGLAGYVASYPIRRENGEVIGVAMLKKSFDKLNASLQSFDRPFFFVDGDGAVMLSNRPNTLDRSLWPVRTRVTLAEQFGASGGPPMLASEITTAAWTTFDGRRGYVLRGAIPQSDWSMLIVSPLAGMFASRFLGIVITLQLALSTLFHFLGKQHGVRESLQMQRRADLQVLADNLEVKATTDPLTGLFNRAKFDLVLGHELIRAERYGTQLALIVYDIDHFKEVNDVHGHQAGDRVLVQLSEIVSCEIRKTDLLARWGGEEFVVVLPATDGMTACLVADKLGRAIAQATFDLVGTITCSFGVSDFVVGDSVETLLARTDNALYRAKINGRNRVEFAPASSNLAPTLELR